MRPKHRFGNSALAAIALLTVVLLAQGCAFDFSGGNFQRLKTFFELTQTFTKGQAALVHTWFFPADVGLKKRWVEVSGRATAPAGGTLPTNATVVARFEDMDGKKLQTVVLKVKIAANGTFSSKKKIKKDIVADSVMLVTVQPVGSDLVAGTGLTLCVDLAASKGDLGKIPDCADGGAQGTATLSELQRDILTPSCVNFGCHNADSGSAGLVLEQGMSYAELVNEPSSQRSQFDRVEPGDPENSYIIKKLRGDSDIDRDRMPQDGPPYLTDAQVARVISWINDGAPDN